MQTQFYTGSATTRAYVQYSSNPLEISTIFVKSFTKSEPHRDNPSLVFRCFTTRDSQSLSQSHWIRRMEEEFSFQEKNITMKIHGWTLNGFASVCPRVSFERAFGNEVLLESLSFPFERIRHFVQAKISKIRAQVTYLQAFDGHSQIQSKDMTVGIFS